jgi:hypothetical protein
MGRRFESGPLRKTHNMNIELLKQKAKDFLDNTTPEQMVKIFEEMGYKMVPIKPLRIIFLDIDGVLNCQVFYDKAGTREFDRESNICKERVSWLNDLCKETGAKVVISSSWRQGRTVEELQTLFNNCGATFEIIDKTPVARSDGGVRGNEIYKWLVDNIEKLSGVKYYEYKDYVIIDDDSDMLLWQTPHFFKVDSYSGLTPNTCWKIKQFFLRRIFFTNDD